MVNDAPTDSLVGFLQTSLLYPHPGFSSLEFEVIVCVFFANQGHHASDCWYTNEGNGKNKGKEKGEGNDKDNTGK
eukprot:4924004-Amphidinium_carterae.1